MLKTSRAPPKEWGFLKSPSSKGHLFCPMSKIFLQLILCQGGGGKSHEERMRWMSNNRDCLTTCLALFLVHVSNKECALLHKVNHFKRKNLEKNFCSQKILIFWQKNNFKQPTLKYKLLLWKVFIFILQSEWLNLLCRKLTCKIYNYLWMRSLRCHKLAKSNFRYSRLSKTLRKTKKKKYLP